MEHDAKTTPDHLILNSILVLAAAASYATSFINCLLTGKWVMLAIILFFPFVGLFHGALVWLGLG